MEIAKCTTLLTDAVFYADQIFMVDKNSAFLLSYSAARSIILQ